MEVKEAVQTAKRYLRDLFSDQELVNMGLEEVDYDGEAWRITLGFSRSWGRKGPLVAAPGETRLGRSNKVLRMIDETGAVESLKDRILAAAPVRKRLPQAGPSGAAESLARAEACLQDASSLA